MVNVKDDLQFYKNSKHITGYVKSKTVDDKNENISIVRVTYEVDNQEYFIDLKAQGMDAEAYEIDMDINLFYNTKNPNDCRTTTRSVFSIYFLVFILSIIGTYGAYMAISHVVIIINNKVLIKKNNVILADYCKIKKKKSYYNTNKGIENYVICKYVKDEKEYSFKSVVMYNDFGHYLKDKQIKVYVDNNNYDKYLVDINDINEKAVKNIG